MSNILESNLRRLEKFRFKPQTHGSDMLQEKMNFLHKIRSTFPFHETKDSFAKPGCLSIDESGIYYINFNDQVCFKRSILDVTSVELGYHADATIIKASEKKNIVISASFQGHFIIWNYLTQKIIRELHTPFKAIDKIELGNENHFFISNKSDVFLIDYEKEVYVELIPFEEDREFELDWKPINSLKEEEMDVISDSSSNPQDKQQILSSDFENQKVQTQLKFEKLTSEAGKKVRKSSLNRQMFLSSLKKKIQTSKPQMIYLSTKSILLLAMNNSIYALDFMNNKSIVSFSTKSPASSITCNSEETLCFVGLKSGIIQIIDCVNMIESGELIGHSEPVSCIVASKGNYPLIFSGSKDGSIRVFHLQLMEEIGQLMSDNELLGKAPEVVEKLKRWKTELSIAKNRSSQSVKFNRKHYEISCISIDSKSNSLVCIYNGKILKWDLEFHYKEFEYITLNPDLTKAIISPTNSQILYIPDGSRITAIDMIHNTLIRNSEETEDYICCLAVSEMDKILAVAFESGSFLLMTASEFTFMNEVKITNKRIEKIEFYTERFIIIVDQIGGVFFYDLETELKHQLDEKFNNLTGFCTCSEDQVMFTATNDLDLKKWNLKPLQIGLPPLETFSFPVEHPINSMSYDFTTKLLFFSQREIVISFDVENQEILTEICPENLMESSPQLPAGSKMFSMSNMKFSINVDEAVYDLIATKTREEFTVLAIYHIKEHNVVVIIRQNGTICCWDESNRSVLLDYYCNEPFIRASKPTSHSNFFFCWNDKKSIECVDIFRLNFFDCCYLQTFSENMSETDFSKKLSSFHQLAGDSPFICKILHPVYMAFFLNRFQTFQLILEEWGFPTSSKFQISPLILSLEGKHVNFAEQLFKEISRYKGPITFMYSEIKTMLEFDYKFVKQLLMNCCYKIDTFTNSDDKIRKFNYLKKDQTKFSSLTGHFTKKNFEQFLFDHRTTADEISLDITIAPGIQNDGEEEDENNNFINRQKAKILKKKEICDKKKLKSCYTDIYKINGYYNFKSGSDDALNFLYRYSQSNVDDFILSDWRRIINYKWDSCRKYFSTLAFFYWSYMLFLILFIFNPEVIAFFYTGIVLVSLLLVYELIPLIIFPKYYLHDLTNFLDLTMYFIALMILVWLKIDPTNETSEIQTLEVISVGIGFYKGISFLRAFNMMRSMTHMIYNLFSSSFDVLLLMIYLSVGITIAMNITMNTQSLYTQFIWVLFMTFCSLPTGEDWSFLHFLVILMLILVLSLIMVNFFIAKMSSKYYELETQQKSTNYKEMAKVLFEFEIWIRILQRVSIEEKYMTYFVIKTNEPSFDLEEDYDRKNQEIQLAEINEAINTLCAQLERVESKIDSSDVIKKDLIKLSANARISDSNSDIREIKAKLNALQSAKDRKN